MHVFASAARSAAASQCRRNAPPGGFEFVACMRGVWSCLPPARRSPAPPVVGEPDSRRQPAVERRGEERVQTRWNERCQGGRRNQHHVTTVRSLVSCDLLHRCSHSVLTPLAVLLAPAARFRRDDFVRARGLPTAGQQRRENNASTQTEPQQHRTLHPPHACSD